MTAHNHRREPAADDTAAAAVDELAEWLCDYEGGPRWWPATDEEEREHYRRTIRALLASPPLASRLAAADRDAAKPGRWWRVIAPDGSLWAETSDEDEARERVRPGDVLQRQYVQTFTEWRDR